MSIHVFAGHLNQPPQDGVMRTFFYKLRNIPWLLWLLICALSLLGIVLLYSASGGRMEPWASLQLQRFAIGTAAFFIAALIPTTTWMRLALPFYLVAIAGLLALPYLGLVNMGAQRWLDLWGLRLQPAEISKIALILALATYYQRIPRWSRLRGISLLPPLFMIALPAALILQQPDLGTMVVVIISGILTMFIAGESLWFFAIMIIGALALAPIAWLHLYPYQKDRILAFFNPESDPLGSGYHILQSKIAIGSGGWYGKGYLQGSQSHLDFLPEKHTDFIFTLLAEEMGFIGCVLVFILYLALMGLCFVFAQQAKNTFARVFTLSFISLFFVCAFINISMVSGLLPVVGIPLPFVSYGGSFMVSMMLGFGIIASTRVHRKDGFEDDLD